MELDAQDDENRDPLAVPEPIQSAVLPYGTTRVMSPRTTNPGLLLGIQASCQRCHNLVSEPAICAQCGTYGHPHCLNLEYFQGYSFCGTCLAGVITNYASMENTLRREQWVKSLAEQVGGWKQRVTSAMGASSSAGVALGGAAAAVAGAALGLVQGVVQGAREGA